jgi:MFS transporter, SP family, general alpha glucoside:H+ symporter
MATLDIHMAADQGKYTIATMSPAPEKTASTTMKSDTMTHIDMQQQGLEAAAEQAIKDDHALSLVQSFKLYPQAIAWSMVLSAASIMDGYDLHVPGLLYAVPAFQKAYGRQLPNGSHQISAAWQSGLNNGSTIGQLVGLYLSGYFTEWVGFRRTLMIALLVTPCIIFIQFFAPSLAVLEVGQVLMGE